MVETLQAFVKYKSANTLLIELIGIVGQELRNTQWSKILSLAPMHV